MYAVSYSPLISIFVNFLFETNLINAQSASLRSLVAAERKAAEMKAAVACFEKVYISRLLIGICLECVCQL